MSEFRDEFLHLLHFFSFTQGRIGNYSFATIQICHKKKENKERKKMTRRLIIIHNYELKLLCKLAFSGNVDKRNETAIMDDNRRMNVVFHPRTKDPEINPFLHLPASPVRWTLYCVLRFPLSCEWMKQLTNCLSCNQHNELCNAKHYATNWYEKLFLFQLLSNAWQVN